MGLYKLKIKPELWSMVSDIPNFVPRFGEMSKVNYNYKGISWEKIRK